MRGPNVSRFAFLGAISVILGMAVACNVGSQPSFPSNASGGPVPFTENQPVTIPAGTTIYIRLQQAVTSAGAQAGQEFSAILDEPVMVENQTIVASGAALTGKVIAARESGHLHNAGYLRISLLSLTVNGKALPLETNSVFAGGGTFRKHDLTFIGGAGAPAAFVGGQKEAGFRPGQQLAFRLTQPVNIASN